jgi:hypothetical protein
MIVKQLRMSDYYPYNPINEYLEVSCELDHDTLKIKSYHDIEDWSYRLATSENDNIANWQGRDNAINIMGENIILAAEKQVRKNILALRKTMKEAKLNPVWLTLKPIADRIIKHYQADFYYHDCKTFYESKPENFIWIVRECGTWLITNKNDFNKNLIEDQQKSTSEYKEVYFYNGGKLNQFGIENLNLLYGRL